MKKILVVILCMSFLLSSCYTVVRVGNCKFYTPKHLGSKGKHNRPIYL